MLAAVIRAPITSILILFEITQSYHIVLPVMITCIIANMISASIEKDSIFTWTLTRAGFNINHGIDKSILESGFFLKVLQVSYLFLLFLQQAGRQLL